MVAMWTETVLTSLFISTVSALNIGVTEQWTESVTNYTIKISSKVLTFSVKPLKVDQGPLTYDQITRDIHELKSLDVDVIIADYHESLAIATASLNISYMCISSSNQNQDTSVFHVIPSLQDFSQAFADLAIKFNWISIGAFYDDTFESKTGITIVEKLMTHHPIAVRMWKVNQGDDEKHIRDFLIQMRKIWIQKVIVFCRNDLIKLILAQARNLAMVSKPYEWSFFDPDGKCLDVFHDFAEVTTNFTVFSLLSSDHTLCGHSNKTDNPVMTRFLTEDAINIIRISARKLPEGLLLSKNHSAIRRLLGKEIESVHFEGNTGNLEFGHNRRRKNVVLEVSEIVGHNWTQIGIWRSNYDEPAERLKLWPSGFNKSFFTPFPLRGRTVNIVMILEKPFTMLKENHELYSGNERFEGFAIDITEEISEMLGFSYNIYLVHDGKFGSKLPSGEWNGIVGELLAGNATMSVAPLSINSGREEAIDFTKPFMTRHISVVMKTPESEASYFEFLNPLSPVVWICTFCAFIGVSFVVYILERIGSKKQLSNSRMSVKDSFWFMFGSLMQGSTDTSPNSISGRIVTSSWWFFALILISSYTANLAAFLTVKKINTPIQSVTDLSQQTKIKYGTVMDSGVMSFFKQTTVEHFAKMWAQMWEIDRAGSMVTNTTEGYHKVLKGDYAFFWDSTVNRYETTKHCSMLEIGPKFDAKGFGIGVPPGATYREKLSLAILKLSDRGRLYELENKWWGSHQCPGSEKVTQDATSELQIENVAGVFFILIGGIVASLIYMMFEKVFNCTRSKYRKKEIVHRVLHK